MKLPSAFHCFRTQERTANGLAVRIECAYALYVGTEKTRVSHKGDPRGKRPLNQGDLHVRGKFLHLPQRPNGRCGRLSRRLVRIDRQT